MAIAQAEDAATTRCEVEIVGDEHRLSRCLCSVCSRWIKRENGFGGFAVEVAGGLVGEQEAAGW
jgi:hypothetical protein